MSTAHPEAPSADDDAYTEIIPIRRRPKIPVLTAALVLALVAAAGVIGGVQIQKHWGGSSSSAGSNATAASFAARARTATGTTGTTRAGSTGGLGFGRAGGGGGATIGTVKLIKGSVIYVSDTDGNTVKVKTTAASRLTKTVAAKLKEIRPGDTLVVVGTTANGTVTASTISIGGASTGGFGSSTGGFGSSSSGGGFGSGSSGGGFGG